MVETDRIGRLVTRGLGRRGTLERRMRSLGVEVDLEMIQFAYQIGAIPEEHLVNVLPTYTSDQPFNERMGHGNMRDGFDFLNLQNAKIGRPLRESEERIIVTAEALRRSHARNGSSEHPVSTSANSVDLACKLNHFKIYFNTQRTHASLKGATPAEAAGDKPSDPVSLDNFKWKKRCGGLFQLPVAA